MIHVAAKSAPAAAVVVAVILAMRKDPDEFVTVHCKFCQHETLISRADPHLAEFEHAKHLRESHADLVAQYPHLAGGSDDV